LERRKQPLQRLKRTVDALEMLPAGSLISRDKVLEMIKEPEA
jgi:hypothetical protein